MENELKKLAAAMRDMSDMVGDHHWQAAKAIDDLDALKSKKAEPGDASERKTFIYPGNQAVKNAIEVLKRPERIAVLEEELAQRDARIAELEHEKAVLRDAIQGRYDMQAASVGGKQYKHNGAWHDQGTGVYPGAKFERELDRMQMTWRDRPAISVGGEREAFEAGLNPHSRRRNEQGDYVIPEIQDRWDGWKARAALSPAGGGVVMPDRKQAAPGDVLSFQSEGWNACLGEVARLNAKPQANSQEGE